MAKNVDKLFTDMVMEVRYVPTLVVLSILVAVMASYVALSLAHNITNSKGRAQGIWLVCGSLSMGVGIWSMHFVGMLACEMPGMEMAYDVPLMLLSIGVAVVGSAIALFVVSRPTVKFKSLIISGVAMALAISGMHYVGMYSMRMAARIEWNISLVLLSILIALGASFAALTISIRLRNKQEKTLLLMVASTLMGFAISGMHYAGMVAATFIHDHSIQIRDSNLLVSRELTLVVVIITLLILGSVLAVSVGQRLLFLKEKRREEDLGQSEEKFRVLVEAVKDYAIFMLDPKGLITTWNSGAEKITGYSANEITGKHVSIFYSTDEGAMSKTEKELSIARTFGHFECEALRVRQDGSQFWANIVIDPLFNKEGLLTGFSTVIRDVTTLKAAGEKIKNINEELEKRVRDRTLALQERELQLRTITNAIPVLVAQVDRNERFLFANNSFCDWFNCPTRQITSKTFRQLLGEDRYPANKVHIDEVLNGRTVNYERESYSGVRKAMLSITFVPEFDLKDRVKGFIIVATDVTRYKEIETELKNSKKAAEVANETKSAFLANMSHEIRTPLGAIIGFSELVVGDETSLAEKQNHIEVIKRNGKLLSTIINDILDLSKVEAGKLEVEKVDVQLFDLLNELTALLNLEATRKSIQLTITKEDDVPSTIKTDPTRLRQILFNIIGNAIKFTEKGSVDVRVKISEANKNHIIFCIKDTGTGILPEQASRLFSPFTQADVTTTRKFGGTGLGLILSKKLAQALGGDVVLDSSAQALGSTFVVSIDHGQSPEFLFTSAETPHEVNMKSTAGTPSERPKNLEKLNILVVDDSADNLLFIHKILTLAGASVETANNGKEGITKAVTGKFNVVLMDLQMPEMDGYAATKELRRLTYAGPIIALTAHAMKEERKRCLENGFNDHITKPVDRKFLIQTLTAYVR